MSVPSTAELARGICEPCVFLRGTANNAKHALADRSTSPAPIEEAASVRLPFPATFRRRGLSAVKTGSQAMLTLLPFLSEGLRAATSSRLYPKTEPRASTIQ